MMIAERQNREKSMHRRRKKEQIVEIANNQDDDDADGDGDCDGDESGDDEIDMEKSTMNVAMVETNEALTVNIKMCILAFNDAHGRHPSSVTDSLHTILYYILNVFFVIIFVSLWCSAKKRKRIN